MRRIRYWTYGFCMVIAVGVLLGGIGIYTAGDPPVEKMEEVRQILSQAEEAGAKIYCGKIYREAHAMYDSARICWRAENRRFIFFRRFNHILYFVQEAEQKGKEALVQAKVLKSGSKEALRTDISRLRKEMAGFEKLFLQLPLDRRIKDKHAEGKLLLNEAEIALDKEDYKTGTEKYRLAARDIRDTYSGARRVLDRYFRDLPQWQKMLEEALRRSSVDNKYLIVVEKVPACCKVYKKGKLLAVYQAEFGRNWLGDKRCEGDYATPEGKYKVIKKKQGRATVYYKALLLDYPNQEDKIAFGKRKKKGELAAHVKIGGAIEIHGDGGKGAYWTNGCVALGNKDMDELYKRIGVGTEVLIIGASCSFNEEK